MTDNTQTEPVRLACMEVWGGNHRTDVVFERPGVDCRIYSRPYRDADQGGDVYYLSSCASGRLTRFLLADVCGHGEQVAETASQLRSQMRRNMNRVRQSRVVESLNNEVVASDNPGRFATAMVGTWLSSTSRLTLSNAGHPPPLLFRAANRSWLIADSPPGVRSVASDMPLRIDGDTLYTESSFKLEHGDMLLCYTDALCEAADARGEMLMSRGLLDLVRSLDSGAPDSLIRQLLERIDSLNASNLSRDDLTVLLLEATRRRPSLADSLKSPWRYLQGLIRSDADGGPQRTPAFPIVGNSTTEQ